MITVEKSIAPPETYPLERLGRREKLLFFDIETTGFSGERSRLYLIGCTYFQGGEEAGWKLVQWFADTGEAEEELLHAFFHFMEGFDCVVHFNGDGFDIPFLLKRCRAYGLHYDFSAVESIDIYKRVRPYRKLLGLDSLKQKAIERFLGIYRQDPYSGGQLIEVYQEYLTTREEKLYDMLMLHNEEDLEGMPLILPILNYPDFLEREFFLKSQEIQVRKDIFGEEQKFLLLSFASACAVPVPVSWDGFAGAQICRGEADGCMLRLEVELYEGTLKYFYPDYQNYYYLIYEDTAIHKSVGEFVDRQARKKATAKTCYCRKTACFLPQTEMVWEPAFRKEYKDKMTFAEYQASLFEDKERRNVYIRSLLRQME